MEAEASNSTNIDYLLISFHSTERLQESRGAPYSRREGLLSRATGKSLSKSAVPHAEEKDNGLTLTVTGENYTGAVRERERKRESCIRIINPLLLISCFLLLLGQCDSKMGNLEIMLFGFVP